jgi:hypothetical protein
MRKEVDRQFARAITLIRIPTYREFVLIRKVAHVMWALWHPERDKDRGNGGRDPDERDDNWMIR